LDGENSSGSGSASISRPRYSTISGPDGPHTMYQPSAMSFSGR
jgi:hypothetical protein